MIRLLWLFISLVIALFSAKLFADEDITLGFRAITKQTKKSVTLLDLMENPEVLSQEIRDKVRLVPPVAEIPPGKTKRIYSYTIKQLFASLVRNADGSPLAVSLQIPPKVTVQREAQQLKVAQLETFIAELQKQHINLDDVMPIIRNMRFDRNRLYPLGQIELQLGMNSRPKLLGTSSLPINVLIDGEIYHKLWVRANLSIEIPCLTPKKILPRGTRLTRSMLSMQLLEINRLKKLPIQTWQEAIDQELTQTAYKGLPLYPSMLMKPPIIRRGDSITIQIRGQGFNIKTKGISLQDGHSLQWIKVKNLSRNKKLRAKVLNHELVEITI